MIKFERTENGRWKIWKRETDSSFRFEGSAQLSRMKRVLRECLNKFLTGWHSRNENRANSSDTNSIWFSPRQSGLCPIIRPWICVHFRGQRGGHTGARFLQNRSNPRRSTCSFRFLDSPTPSSIPIATWKTRTRPILVRGWREECVRMRKDLSGNECYKTMEWKKEWSNRRWRLGGGWGKGLSGRRESKKDFC